MTRRLAPIVLRQIARIKYLLIAVLLSAVSVWLAGCATSPPAQISDLCAIFDEKTSWYRDALESQARWGTPIPVMMAIIRHESAFRANAKPPRKKFLWIFPGARPSSAYGYPQALDGTWDTYLSATGNGGADRDDFADAIDFVGWYTDVSNRRNGIAKADAYNLYLTYYEGHGGYRQGRHRGKTWLLNVAKRVANTANTYQQQLSSCESRLGRGGSWWPFS